jgi:membrane-bound metal-dependent hydrolase YbcI (DUF457 family)
MGTTHAASGAAVWLAAAPALDAAVGLSGLQVATGAVLCAGAALLPDLDMPNSTIGRALGPVSFGLAWILARATGGHRGGTHSLLGVAAFTAAAAGAAAVGGAIAGLLVWLLLALAVRGSTRTGWTLLRTFGTGLVAVLVVTQGWTAGLPWVVGLGAAAHVVGDCLTDRGCPLLWPVSRARYGVPLVTTRGWFEPVVRWGCVAACVALVASY